MSKLVLTNATVVFEGVYDFSDLISSITISTVHDVLDVTPVKDGVIYKEVIAGVGTNSVSFEFYQDLTTEYGAGTTLTLEEFFNGYRTSGGTDVASRVGTKVACAVRALNAPISNINPEYRFDALVTEWTPLNASVGGLSTITANWPISGAITKDVTP
jgi:hypothetical protein